MKWKLWLNLATLVVLSIIIFLAWPDIVKATQRSMTLDIWPLLATIPLQFLFYAAMAKFFFYFFEIIDAKVRFKTLVPAMIELNFVNHLLPSGGLSGFSYLTLRLRSYDVSTAKSTLAQIARFAFTFIAHIFLAFVALLFLAIEDRASSLVVLLVSGVVFTLLFCMGIIIFVIGSKDRIVWFSKVLARCLNKMIHFFRRRHPETIKLTQVEKTFLELHEDYQLTRSHIQQTRKAFWWMLLSVLTEMIMLYAVFAAHGEWVNPGAVVLALIIASSAGLIAALPGGVGIYEPLMSAVFIAVGVSPDLAISATLVFRIISLLLSLLTGYVLYHRAIQRYGTADLQRQ